LRGSNAYVSDCGPLHSGIEEAFETGFVILHGNRPSLGTRMNSRLSVENEPQRITIYPLLASYCSVHMCW